VNRNITIEGGGVKKNFQIWEGGEEDFKNKGRGGGKLRGTFKYGKGVKKNFKIKGSREGGIKDD